MGRASVSEKQKIQVETLLKDDQTHRMVAKKVGVSKCCVSNVAQKLKNGQSLKNVPGQGRKRLTTPRDDRRLLQLYKADRSKSSR